MLFCFWAAPVPATDPHGSALPPPLHNRQLVGEEQAQAHDGDWSDAASQEHAAPLQERLP